MIDSRRKVTGNNEAPPQARLKGGALIFGGRLAKQAAVYRMLPWRQQTTKNAKRFEYAAESLSQWFRFDATLK